MLSLSLQFCTIKDGQNINRLLSGNPQKKMLGFCTEKPGPKAGSIIRTVRNSSSLFCKFILFLKIIKFFHIQVNDLSLLDPKHKLLTQFGVSLPSREMHKLPNTRILAPPELCYGGSNNGQGSGRGRLTPSDGVWDMWGSNLLFYEAKNVTSWAIVGVGLRNGLNP